MQCLGCGFSGTRRIVGTRNNCPACGDRLRYDAEDFLLHQEGGFIREVRPGQVAMGRAVESAMFEEEIALIEGPVGIGKSFAYLIPAIASGKRVVISTAKKQLQHQLVQKDAPYLIDKMRVPSSVAVIKGKNNYACKLKLQDEVPRAELGVFRKWLDHAPYGDITEYPGAPPPYWNAISATDCIGRSCVYNATCGYRRAKNEAAVAKIVVANHSLVAADLRFGPKKLLGEYSTLIIDEAHQVEAAFRGSFESSITPGTCHRLLRLLDNTGVTTGLEKALETSWKQMFQELRDLDGEIAKDPFGEYGHSVRETLVAMQQIVKNTLSTYVVDQSADPYDEDSYNFSDTAKLAMLTQAIQRVTVDLSECASPSPNTVLYVSDYGKDRKQKSITISPISIGPIVGPKLNALESVIITSATLTVGGSFEPVKYAFGLHLGGTLGKPKKCTTLVLDSPFNYTKQAVLYTPKHLPLPVSDGLPGREEYIAALAEECNALTQISNGNAFILFSATSDMQAVHLALRKLSRLPLVTQGDDAEATLRQYMVTPNAVLLGLKSFWEGVDVQGEKLSLVIIPKLPFPIVSDPVLLAKSRKIQEDAAKRGVPEKEAAGVVFRTLQVPLMVTDLRQGTGRLIRSATDRGVCAILDSRIWTGSSKRMPLPTQKTYEGYGATAVNAIGFKQRTSDIRVIQKYFSILRGM